MDATTLVSGFNALILQLSRAFTVPTAETFRQLLVGWVLSPHPGSVTGMIRTLGCWASKHWTVYEKFFYRASWSPQELSRLLMLRLVRPLLGKTVHLNIDDTTCGPRGKHVAFAGWWKDHSAHARKDVFHWSHNWIIAAISLRLKRWPLMRLALPIACALYRKRSDCDTAHPYASLPRLAAGMVAQLVKDLPETRFFVAVDAFYGTRDFFGKLPPNVAAVTRLRRDAALFERPAPKPQGVGGRPRKKGQRLPAVAELAQNLGGWKTVTLRRQGRTVRRAIAGRTCLWYHLCKERPVRVVIVRDPEGKEDDLHLVCSDPAISDVQIAQRYFDRWGIEECIEEAKQQMGMERTRGWCRKTVQRQAPLAMLLTSLVKLSYIQHADQVTDLLPPELPWYRHKQGVSYRDMLGALRLALWRQRVLSNSHAPRESIKTLTELTYALCHAA